MRIIPIALAGLRNAQARADRAAQKIVEAGTDGAAQVEARSAPTSLPPSGPLVSPPFPEADLITSTVDLKTARTAFAAAARLLKTADELDRSLIETGDRIRERRG
ncbi:MAG: hypothetical protein D6757_08145 [Alphaproteobacteria bacterium]|nr:MAG: hypothetical protein D6757_08145 [Alphaproteobacteria bacterium]